MHRSVFEDNDRDADRLRAELRERGVFLVNLMSSPGAGKTTALLALIRLLSPKYRIGVLEADIDSDVDGVKVASAGGCRAIQLHTGGMCHLDADMTRQGLLELGTEGLDLVFLENVGNLVCPAEFDAGACLDAALLSVPEGDDKPLKYPLVFQKSGLVLITKMDTLAYFPFDLDRCRSNIRLRNPRAAVFPVSARTGEGMQAAADFLSRALEQWKE